MTTMNRLSLFASESTNESDHNLKSNAYQSTVATQVRFISPPRREIILCFIFFYLIFRIHYITIILFDFLFYLSLSNRLILLNCFPLHTFQFCIN